MCPIVVVALGGFLSCSHGTPGPNMTAADEARQYTIIEAGDSNASFCVAGTTLNQAYDIGWNYTRGFLKAHAEPCIPAACEHPHDLFKGDVRGWWKGIGYSFDHPLAPCP